ncbi:MAG: hypothetical protein NT093_01640 [Candidatus Moranbacteria bacterium]|nr:hypothetical protein [Candidatus Moranbacteria bacterium]
MGKQCVIGTIKITKTEEIFPFCLVDVDPGKPSSLELILDQAPFSLSAAEGEKDKFTYFIHGKTLIPILGTGGVECEPFFSCFFTVDSGVHMAFQKELCRINKWMMIIRTRLNVHLIIDFGSGHILEKYSTPRDQVRMDGEEI